MDSTSDSVMGGTVSAPEDALNASTDKTDDELDMDELDVILDRSSAVCNEGFAHIFNAPETQPIASRNAED